jgi:hypothetical protein
MPKNKSKKSKIDFEKVMKLLKKNKLDKLTSIDGLKKMYDEVAEYRKPGMNTYLMYREAYFEIILRNCKPIYKYERMTTNSDAIGVS